MSLFIKLLLSHLVGDFLLQTDKMVRAKEANKALSASLYLHLIIHGALAWGLTGRWDLALIIMLSHGVIDGFKLYLQSEKSRRIWFFVDQMLHLIVIGVLSLQGELPDFLVLQDFIETNIYVITGGIFLTTPASVILRFAISRWDPESLSASMGSLEKAGSYIGILERLFVFVFVLYGQWSAIGFLIAAKSVFRFGDLREAHNRKLTEYILIGTLLSVGIAVATGAFVLGMR